MTLPIERDYAPMEAKLVADLPSGANWQFEPKWDGFRTLVFRDGGEIMLQSRDEKPMNRYFPELIDVIVAITPSLRAWSRPNATLARLCGII